MFKIIEGNFKDSQYSNEEYLDNWPLLYILENGKQAYIGESTHAKTRMTQHATVEEKRIFEAIRGKKHHGKCKRIGLHWPSDCTDARRTRRAGRWNGPERSTGGLAEQGRADL